MIKRSCANEIIRGLIVSADQINGDPRYMHWIEELCVFGSYLTDKATLGDLDIAFRLKARWPGTSSYENAHRKFLADFPPPRHIAQNWMERMFWPERLILRTLRVGRNISFHGRDELDILGCEHRPFYTLHQAASP